MRTGSGRSRPRIGSLILLAAACGYSLIAATTTPFTTGADIVTALPMVALVGLLTIRWPWRTKSIRRPPARPGHPYLPWVILFVAVGGWEIFNYLVHGSRSNHPTFSSMTTAVNRYYLLKALDFLAWFSLGWMIVRRGSRSMARARARSQAESVP
ncbi:MAG TPA: hypothetical protein VG298_14065 [Acidimicrobiales bacterium]|jgi:hypothetical protein|nr:hypothetical protein [Acidimicrobiales bacterium]